MTSRSYFGKMNSTLGPVVPLAIFEIECYIYETDFTLGLSHVFEIQLKKNWVKHGRHFVRTVL